MRKTTSVLVIGGGLQAVTLGAGLAHTRREDFTIVDDRPLLTQWLDATGAIGMTDLRSPVWAHVGPEEDEIPSFALADSRWAAYGADRLSRTKPVPLDLFNAHAKATVDQFGLEDRRVNDRVSRLATLGDMGGFLATMQSGETFEAEHVVVATGFGERMYPPGFFPGQRLVHHISDLDLRNSSYLGDSVAVIGGGLTSATVVVQLIERGLAQHVCFCTRGQFTVAALEADAAWLPGGDLFEMFRSIPNPFDRRATLAGARTANRITPPMWREVMRHVSDGTIELRPNYNVHGDMVMQSGGKVALQGTNASFDRILLGTGYRTGLEHHRCLENLHVAQHAGFPVLTGNYQSVSHPDLYFMGCLAEDAGGAFARNLMGARHARLRILNNLC